MRRVSMRGRPAPDYAAPADEEGYGDDESGSGDDEEKLPDAEAGVPKVGTTERLRQERMLKEMQRLMPGSSSHARAASMDVIRTTSSNSNATGETGRNPRAVAAVVAAAAASEAADSDDEEKPRLRRRSTGVVSYREPTARDYSARPASPEAPSETEAPRDVRVGDWLEVEVRALPETQPPPFGE